MKKLELYEKMIKAEIQKRVEIEKHFAREADQIQIKVSILEEQMKLRSISDEIIERFLNSFRVNERIGKDGKRVIRKGHGEKVYDLIIFYERLIKRLTNDLASYSNFIDRLLSLLMTADLKEKLVSLEHSNMEPIEKRKAKFDLIEQQLASRQEAEKVLGEYLKGKMYEALSKDPLNPCVLDNGKKSLIKEGLGDKVANLIEYYENNLAGLKNKAKEVKTDHLDSLLELVLPPEDKTRTLNFVKNGDLASAAWVLNNQRNLPHNRTESASKFSMGTLNVPKERRSLRSNTYRSLTPNKSNVSNFAKEVGEGKDVKNGKEFKDSDEFKQKYLKVDNEDLIVFLQCQANGLEELLFNS